MIAASCDIDCNRPLDGGSDEFHPREPSEVHVSLSSTSKQKEKISTLQVHDFMERSAGDEGKFIVDSQPALTGASSKNNGIQVNCRSPFLFNNLEALLNADFRIFFHAWLFIALL